MDKRGQGSSSIGVIIAIALGVLLLVLLVFGVSGGFGTLWSKVTEIGGTDNNIADVARGCEVACASNNVYDYCERKRTLEFGKDACVDAETGLQLEDSGSNDCADSVRLSCNEAADNGVTGMPSCDISC